MPALTIEQVQDLFNQEADGRLRSLGRLLLELELAPDDEGLVRSVFRELHTIKGSAAVAGLEEVSRVAHQLEELVEEVRSGKSTVTHEVIDTLLAGTDQLGGLVSGDGNGTAGPTESAINETPAPKITTSEKPSPVKQATEKPATEKPPVPHPAPSRPASAAPTPRPADTDGVVAVPIERLDELVRLLGESAAAHLRVGQMLTDRFGVDPATCAEFNELSRSLNGLQERAMRTRMVPISTITDQLHRAVRDLARAQGKSIRWEVAGAATELDRGVLDQLSDSLLHLIRNAVDHGIEPPEERAAAGKPAEATIRLHAMQLGSEVIIAVTDDGRGIDVDRVRQQAVGHGIDVTGLDTDQLLELTFLPGMSTKSFVTDISGRGVGLDVVRTNVEAARGRVEVRSELGAGAEFRVIVPITLAVLRCLLVEAGGQRFALPFHRVVRSQPHEPAKQFRAEGRPAIWVDDQPVPISILAQTLGLPETDNGVPGPIVVLADTARRHAFQVDRLIGQREVVLKGLSRLLPHLPAVAGASVEPTGSIFVVLDPPGLIHRARQVNGSYAADDAILPSPARDDTTARRVLVVDDALTVRELQRSILQRAGFDVLLANDGQQALATLAEEPVELVLTDVEMPNMDGFALTAAIRAHPQLANIPVLILSSRSSKADRQRGLDVGADGYIIKSGFDEAGLLAAVNRLLGQRP